MRLPRARPRRARPVALWLSIALSTATAMLATPGAAQTLPAANAADSTVDAAPDSKVDAAPDSTVDAAPVVPLLPAVTPPQAVVVDTTSLEPVRGPWWTLWSWRSPHDRIIGWMITTHLYELDEGPTNNHALGLIYHGMFGATFITTHGPRGWVAGFERAWLEGSWGPIRTMVGFRAGLVYGYDERLFAPAAWTPILPYGQPVLLARAGPISLDFTYTWVVVSLMAGITLW